MKIEINVGLYRNLSVLILSIAFTRRIGDFETAWFVPYLLCVPLYICLSLAYYNDDSFDREEIKHTSRTIFWMVMTPYVIALFYSFLLILSGQGIVGSILRSFSVTGKEAAAIALAIFVFSYFRDEAMEIFGNAMILSYIYSMIIAAYSIGIAGFTAYLTTFRDVVTTGFNQYFEMHDIGLSIGFCIMYELFFAKRTNKIRTVLMLVVMIICWKRIALMALIVVGAVWFVTRNKHEQFKNFQIGLVMTGVLAFCFVYVMLLSTGALYVIAARYGFDFSNRRFMYSFFGNLYEWKITFLGHGLGSVGKYMTSLVGTAAGAQIQGFRQIHNDILKTYIELGFIGSFLWFLWYTWRFPKVISERIGGDCTVRLLPCNGICLHCLCHG